MKLKTKHRLEIETEGSTQGQLEAIGNIDHSVNMKYKQENEKNNAKTKRSTKFSRNRKEAKNEMQKRNGK